MAPNKFEKHIKKQLEEREIAPSNLAWQKLSEKLDEVQPQTKKSNYLWYGIAASFIGLLMVAIMYFNDEGGVDSGAVEIVNVNEEVTPKKETNPIHKMNHDVEDKLVERNTPQPLPKQDVKKKHVKLLPILENSKPSVVANETNDLKKATIEKLENEMINAKILEVVATVDSLEHSNTALTNLEVEELLRQAQDELLRDKLFNKNGTVDAMALLDEVEGELDKSFRDQIFESLKAGFFKVRTAVADRNK